MNRHEQGFAALLMVISLSVSILAAMAALSESELRLRNEVELLADRTQRQLSAESCRQLAVMYISEDPEYSAPVRFNLEDIECTIDSISRMAGSLSPFADRVIVTTGVYKNVSATLISVIGVSNFGIVEKQKYFK